MSQTKLKTTDISWDELNSPGVTKPGVYETDRPGPSRFIVIGDNKRSRKVIWCLSGQYGDAQIASPSSWHLYKFVWCAEGFKY